MLPIAYHLCCHVRPRNVRFPCLQCWCETYYVHRICPQYQLCDRCNIFPIGIYVYEIVRQSPILNKYNPRWFEPFGKTLTEASRVKLVQFYGVLWYWFCPICKLQNYLNTSHVDSLSQQSLTNLKPFFHFARPWSWCSAQDCRPLSREFNWIPVRDDGVLPTFISLSCGSGWPDLTLLSKKWWCNIIALNQ